MPPRKPPAPSNAALYFVSAGFTTSVADLMGISTASEGLLRALVHHGGTAPCTALVDNGAEGEAFRRTVALHDPARTSGWIHISQAARLASLGTLLLPGPGLPAYAWARQRHGARAWSLCGVTHTTATPRVLDLLAGFATAPVQPWDALICTSHAARAMVTQVLDDQDAWLAGRLGGRPAPRPLLPVIPLGIFCDDVAASPGARAAWRDRLALAPDDVAALFVGRFSVLSKAHAVPLFEAAQLAAARLTGPRVTGARRLVLVMAGWFGRESTEADYHAAARRFCPGVRVIFLDGRLPDVRRDIWSAADLFVSPADNIQETFGLTPVEAMAAGLPVVVSDWNGYRDTVQDGVEGFRVPTIAGAEGVCGALNDRFADGSLEYSHFVGAVAQNVAVDVAALAQAIWQLAENPALRRRMGQAGQHRARTTYDWSIVMAEYRRLWREQATLRGAQPPRAKPYGAQPRGEQNPWPARPDPGRAFAAWPSHVLRESNYIRRVAAPPATLADLLASPLVAYEGATLPPRRELQRLLSAASEEWVSVTQLLGADHSMAMQSILWLTKYGLLEIVAEK